MRPNDQANRAAVSDFTTSDRAQPPLRLSALFAISAIEVTMSLQHHSEGMSPELRNLFDNAQASRDRFNDQVAGRAKRSWSDGRAGAADDGDLAFVVGSHPEKELVVVDFGKPVEWVAMPPQQAIELAQALIKHARAIATSPVAITLH